MTRLTLPLRAALVGGLALSALTPLAVLAIASVGRGWFFPRLLPSNLDVSAWAELLGGAHRLAAASVHSLGIAGGTGLLAAAIGLFAGRAIAELRGWRRVLGAAAAFLPVAAPPIALGVGLQLSFLTAGLGGTAAGVLLAHLIPAAGYTSLFFLGIFSSYDSRLEDESRSLGASRAQTFWLVTLPTVRRPLIEAAVLGFLVSWAQVPLTLLIGQGLVPTLPVEVLGYVQAGQDRYAATGALMLVVPPLLLLALAGVAIRRAEVVPA